MTDKELFKLALDALNSMKEALAEHEEPTTFNEDEAITAIKEALAQPEQEPVAWIEKDMQCDDFDPDSVTCEKPTIAANGWEWVALYTHPPQRTEQEPVALDLSQVNRLTHFKTNGIIDAQKYNITGFVLTNGDGKKCISDMAAVRWFDNKDFFGMMHNEPAQRTEPVIDKSAAIRIATALGWTPPKENT